jgi:hypothetical protein
MRVVVFFILVIAVIIVPDCSIAQNVSVNALTLNSGIVKNGETVFYEVQINNTDNDLLTGLYKLKVQVSIADSSTIVIKADTHILPTGWKILSNSGTVITFSNCKDIIAPNDVRKLLIAIEGKQPGGPVMIASQLSFADGIVPGTNPGIQIGDNPLDNFSSSTCKVIN